MVSVQNQEVGYDALRRRYAPNTPPYHRHTSVAIQGAPRRRSQRMADGEWHTLPASYTPNGVNYLAAHLEFALKHEGVDISLLASLFVQPGVAADLEEYVHSRPTGQYARKAWFLYEFLTGCRLDLPDASQGGYVNLLDPAAYVTGTPVNSPRQRVRNNLLGNADFCPMVRRTPELEGWMAKQLNRRASEVVAEFAPEILARAARYLYMKETKSSYEIERERPDQRRMLRFVEALKGANRHPLLDKELLVQVQQAVMDERYAEDDYRISQNYVGETAVSGREIIHHIGARPENVARLMDGLVACQQRMRESSIDPIIEAAIVAFGFVYIHPFEDGNGRLHRFLIHQVLSSTGYTPDGLVFPVSATMLTSPRDYDAALESVSRPRLELIQYLLRTDGSMEVRDDTRDLYRCWDATAVCEYLFGVVEQTIEQDLVSELNYLVGYDQAKREMRDVVDMPDQKADLFIRLVTENHGKLSATKKSSHFSELMDTEIERLEEIVVKLMKS